MLIVLVLSLQLVGYLGAIARSDQAVKVAIAHDDYKWCNLLTDIKVSDESGAGPTTAHGRKFDQEVSKLQEEQCPPPSPQRIQK